MATLDEKIAACFLETNRQWEFHEKLVPALEKPRGPKGRPAPRGTVDTAASVDAGARTEAFVATGATPMTFFVAVLND